MKKILKISLIMGCFAMICTSVISFTFAQFMTTQLANNTATMAKWGVEVTSTGDLFSDTYTMTDARNDKSGNSINLSVDSADADKVVAPGTSNSVGISFGITGTPEVAVNIDFNITAQDIFLKDTENVETVLGITLEGDYYPVVCVLKKGGNTLVTGTLAQIEEYLEGFNGNYEPNTDLTTTFGTYTLTWSYAFSGHEFEDTLLGNIAAEKTYTPALVDVIDYELDTSFNISITVTQLD